MKYLNQLMYPHLEYPTNVREPESDLAKHGTVAEAGCGPCCMCMVVDRLTTEHLPLEECVRLSVQHGANRNPGTDLELLIPPVAERFHLNWLATSEVSNLIRCLQSGGAAIINVGGDRVGYTGLFSHRGHYVLAIGFAGDEVCVLDPSWTPDKYEDPGRATHIRVSGFYTYCTPETLAKEAENRDPGFFLFFRESDAVPAAGAENQPQTRAE